MNLRYGLDAGLCPYFCADIVFGRHRTFVRATILKVP